MEFILLIIFSLVFTLIKSLAEKGQGTKPTEPKFEKYPVGDRPKQSDKKSPTTMRSKKDETVMPTSPKKYPKYQELEIQVQELEDETQNEIGGNIAVSLEHDEIIKGIIMSEVLESPRFKKPHKIS